MGYMMDWQFHWPLMSGWIAIFVTFLFAAFLYVLGLRTTHDKAKAFDQNSVIIIFAVGIALLWAFGMHLFWATIVAAVAFFVYWSYIRPRL